MNRLFLGVVFVALACSNVRLLADEYGTADEAYAAGAKLHRAQDYAASQVPFEAALKLAPDDEYKLKVYQALVPAYRLLPEIDKMLVAGEFIIRHSPQKAARSLNSSSLASFLFQRGKLDVAIERYEARLKDDPKDLAALGVLSVIYLRLQRNAERSEPIADSLNAVNREVAQRLAMKHEQAALAAPQLCAWYLKEAAVAWLEAEQPDKALAAAKKSAASPPEQRSEILTHFWHAALGDVFLQTGEPNLAIPQLEAAIANTNVEGYRGACQLKLEQARAASANQQ